MWSGPRNISTAMMRAWENRRDCAVVDEPLYAAYLAATGLDHPMREEVLANQPTNYAAALAGLERGGAALQYEKHMTHHLLPAMDLSWLSGVTSAFLIREPRRVVASYARRRGAPTLEDLGYPQQTRIYEFVRGLGEEPPVLLASDVVRDPRGALRALCGALGVAFDEAMLEWPAGPRESDGVWAAHWYARVWASTGFEGGTEEPPVLSEELEALAAKGEPHFEELFARRLRW